MEFKENIWQKNEKRNRRRFHVSLFKQQISPNPKPLFRCHALRAERGSLSGLGKLRLNY
jgi:hypothetical protein